jgi:hypothetical protein
LSAVQERSLGPHPAPEQASLTAVVRCLQSWYASIHHSARAVEDKEIEANGAMFDQGAM